MRRQLRTTWIICAVFWATVFRISVGLAQILDPITPSGLNTQVNLSSTPPAGEVQYDITGGTRVGGNLFHSFSQFDVPTNNIANFLNDSGLVTSNILGRVNGGHPSNIFGTIQTEGFGSANLFLMNPSGIIFGPTASLNVGGSVTFTTSDYLRLDKVDGSNAGTFHTDPIRVSLLTSAPVDAFGFLGTNPGTITVQGSQLIVPKEYGISLIGGNIAIQNGTLGNGTAQAAHLSAPNGQINLATARSSGEFLQDLIAAPNINGASFISFASVHLEPGSTVDVSHTGNGKVTIRGGQLALEIQNTVLDTAISSSPGAVASNQDTIALAPKSSIISQTSSLVRSPDVSISADRITIVGVSGSKESFFEKPFTGVESTTKGTGSAGDITLRATEDLVITKVVNLQSIAMPQSTGTAGNIKLISTKGNILMTEGAVEAQAFSLTESSGNTGTVTASAPEGDIVLDGGNLYTQSHGSGRVGSVEITAKNLSMRAGLLSNGNFSAHKPGGIMVTLSGKLTMTADPSLDLPAFAFPNSLIVTSAFNPTNEAPAGDISLTAKDIVATEGSLISSETFAAGAGGQLKIVADTLQLKDGSQIKSGSTFAPPVGGLPPGVTPTGPGGDIAIQGLGSNGSVVIDGAKSGIFSNTEGTGAGGTINLSARALTIQNGGTISASTTGTDTLATGGSVIIKATDQVTMTNGASITASSTGPGNAGSILVKANGIAVSGGATITASSTGAGKAGTVTIQDLNSPVQSFLIDGNGSGVFTNTTKSGAGGDITVSSSSIQLRNNGRISAETSGTDVTATGGKIRVDGTKIRIENGALVTSSSTGPGPGGDIDLIAGQSVTIENGASTSASSTGPGNAGNIFINAGQQLEVLDSPNAITTQAARASGGNIDIRAIDRVRLVNSSISTSVLSADGSGGNIFIDPKVVILEGSSVTAQAVGGTGGQIKFVTPLFLADSSSTVSAQSQRGPNGTVTIQSPTSNLSGVVGQLVSKTSPPQVLLQNRCVALAGSEQSTFFLAGHDTLPTEPGGWLRSPVSMEHWMGEDTEHASGLMVRRKGPIGLPRMIGTMDKTQVLSLRGLTPPGFLVQSFAGDSPTGCRS